MPAVEDGSFHLPSRAVDTTRRRGGSVGRLLIAACLLCAATYFTQESRWRYVAVVDDLLSARLSQATQAGWQMTDAGADVAVDQGQTVFRLAAVAGQGPSAAWVRLSLPPDLQGVLVTAEAKSDRIVPGREGWETGRIQVNSFDSQGRYLWYWPGLVADVSGTTDWRPFREVIPVTGDLTAAYLVIYNGAQSGVMSVRNLQVAGAVERPAFAVLRPILIVSWALLGLWGAWLLVRTRRRAVPRAALLGLMAAALAGILTPQPYLGYVSAPIEDLIKSVLVHPAVPTPTAQDDAAETRGTTDRENGRAETTRTLPASREAGAFELSLKQAGHFAVFACLVVALGWAFPHLSGFAPGFYLLLFAVATESLQLFLITRSARMIDLAIDAAGILVGLGALTLLRRLTGRLARWSGNVSRGPRP